MNFARLLFDAAASHPDRVALTEGDRVLTLAQLAARAAAIAEALILRGTRPGDRVGIVLPHGADGAAAFFGALAAGAIGVNINALYRPRQVEYVLSHCDAQALLTSAAWRALQPRDLNQGPSALNLDTVPDAGCWTPVHVRSDAPAQITYTSGSTGSPKGVVMSHANLWAGVAPVMHYLQLSDEDRIASLLPFSFVYGFSQLTCALASGARLDIVPAGLSADIVTCIAQLEATVIAAVPPLWMQLLRVPRFQQPMPRLRVLTCAGGRLAPEVVRALRSAQPQAQLFLMYGFTEVFRSTYLPADKVDSYPDSIGRAIEGSRVLVQRPDGTECLAGEVGELVHLGPSVALGYWNDPAATEATFSSVPGRTAKDCVRAARSGDLVRRDTDGLLYFVGRRDRMIKTLGMRVSPDEVSDVLYASGQVCEAAVTAESDEQRGERIVAHVVLTANGTLQELRQYARTELPRHMQPVRWDVRESLPRNASGKHDLMALEPE